MKRAFYLIIGFVGVLTAILISNVYESKREYAIDYNFEIKRIDIKQNGYIIFYDSIRTEYAFTSYIFDKNDCIEEGDKIVKKANSKLLYVFRKNRKNYKYELFLTKKAKNFFE
ncbi:MULTISPECIES: hypothetical protein [unclassified Flavobacterium]|uniref:hypothetical protein n=1 Tax=unclassified Flavobacterium TaxID=196869 RepID=UPI00104A7961|nr:MULTISPECIES: hypothetical protein [unclassified Flavobacterium]